MAVPGKVIGQSEENDACLLSLETGAAEPLPASLQRPREGEVWQTFGYPSSKIALGHRLAGTVAQVLDTPKLKVDLDLSIDPSVALQTYKGMSGAVVVCQGAAVGMIRLKVDGTIAALFSPQLWTSDGLASQAGDLAFWDRSTLYGLRGVFQAGETTTGLRYLTAYTNRRLLGDHVPYPVEAWPEGDQRHLSSESGLYCRIFTEGLFGMLPTGLARFRCTPRLPAAWPRMALRSVRAFNRNFDVLVERRGELQHLSVIQAGNTIAEFDLKPGESADVHLP